jgi:hypothetical protein
MGFKDLLVVVGSAADTRGRNELAVSLAEQFAAHLVGLYPIPSPELPRSAGYSGLAVLEPIYRDGASSRSSKLRPNARCSSMQPNCTGSAANGALRLRGGKTIR